MSDALGGEISEHYQETIRSFGMSKIIESGVDLTQFSIKDYSYDPRMDVIFVRVGSPLFTWISLHE
jgi:hypothetical protein